MYLHGHENWTHFTWDEDAILPLLSDARFAQGKLLGRVRDLGFSLDSEIELATVSEDIVASSRIEGVALDAAQVRSSVARNLGLADYDPALDTQSVDGAVAIMMDATRHFDEPLTFERLAGWHNALFPTGYSGLRKITVADYRTGSMSVVSGPVGHERTHYVAPHAEQVPALMDEFFAWVNGAALDPMLKAGIAHLWFLTIHPFDDGNGRIARTITEMLLVCSDGSERRFYSLASYILKHREQYYGALERSQKGSPDITEWLRWFLEALHRAIDTSMEAADDVVRRSNWWRTAEGIAFNSRQRMMAQRLLGGFEGKLTTSKWAKICKVSPDTALRDINDLIAKGILIRDDSAGGRSTAYMLKK